MIVYVNDPELLVLSQFRHEFFVGWQRPLTAEQHLQALKGSTHAMVAIDKTNDQIVGFITAITDGLTTAFIPLLEVTPAYQNTGIGTALMTQMLVTLNAIPNIDLMCDQELQPFYERFGMKNHTGMLIRKDPFSIAESVDWKKSAPATDFSKFGACDTRFLVASRRS